MEVGLRLRDLLDAGDMPTIYEQLYSPDIVSIEAGGDSPECRGMAAVDAKNEGWDEQYVIHAMDVDGPFPNGDEFAMIYTMDITHRATSRRKTVREVALYTVERGQIVREKFYYVPG
jgi:hypothetical protein